MCIRDREETVAEAKTPEDVAAEAADQTEEASKDPNLLSPTCSASIVVATVTQ